MSAVIETKKVELFRSFDYSLCAQVLSHPIIFDAISEDGVSMEDLRPDVMNEYWIAFWLGEQVIGVFQVKQVCAQMWDAHIHILPSYRKQYTQECGTKMWRWIEENLKSGLIYTNVPVFCENVIKFLIGFEFKESGILKNAWRKNGKQNDLVILTREI